MHDFGCAKNGIYRTGLNAESATNAILFINYSDLEWNVSATIWIKCKDWTVEQLGERCNARFAARWTAIDWSRIFGDGARIRRAAIKTTFRALCLREQTIDAFGQH
jgi:hypothetical protein